MAKIIHALKHFNVFDHCDINREPIPHSPTYNKNHQVKKERKLDPDVFEELESARFREADKNITKIVHDPR